MAKMIPILERRYVPEGRDIFVQGEEGDMTAYIIQSGSVSVLQEKDGKQVEIAKHYQGEIVGEAALVLDEPRAATVRTLQDCNLIIINRQVMDDKVKESDLAVRAVIRLMKERLKSARPTGGVGEVNRLFSDAFKLVVAQLTPGQRKAYQQEASPILREFLNLTQNYIDGKK